MIKFVISSLLFFLFFACNSGTDTKNSIPLSQLEKQYTTELKKIDYKDNQKRFEFLDDYTKKAKKEHNKKVQFLTNYEKGNFYYSTLNIDASVIYWKKALNYSHQINDLFNQANLNNNIGIIYLQKGYMETAINYFLAAVKIKEKLKQRDENYWSIYINIGVANMSLNQLERAAYYFNLIPKNSSNQTKFLIYLNQAKLQAIKKNEHLFYQKLDLAKRYLSPNSFYSNIFDEVSLEVSLEFKNKKRLNQLLNAQTLEYDKQPLFIQLMLQRASIIINGKTIGDIDLKNQFSQDLIEKEDIFTKIAFQNLLATYYHLKKDYKSYANCLVSINELNEQIKTEEAKTTLNDYFLVLYKNKLAYENEQLKTSNELKSLKIKNQRYVTIFLVMAILGLLVLGWFVVKYYRKSHLEKEKDVTYMQLNLEQQITERPRLQKLVQNQEFKIKEILTNVSKIAILKKQMEEFIATMSELNSSETEKDLAKQAKLNTDAFFNNYIDLAILASQKDDKDFMEVKTDYNHLLSENEMNVLLLILNDYTTKEIAILLSKSEKGIEYSRKNIRMKLNIPKEMSINQFVIEDLG